jgi:hypothetical protein
VGKVNSGAGSFKEGWTPPKARLGDSKLRNKAKIKLTIIVSLTKIYLIFMMKEVLVI